MIHSTLCGVLIVFFSWVLLHALLYSKSDEGRIIEGLEPSPTPTPPGSGAATGNNADQIAALKQQVASLTATANQLNVLTIQNEADIANNTASIQKVMQSQNETNAKMASMKKAQ